jgi:dolichol-phosphate mannosyltransferase
MIQYSVVIPLKNEENNISELIQELEPVMEKLQKPWELICIDDGSTDGTRDVLVQLANRMPYLKVIAFKKNYGQSAAFHAGFQAAEGEFIISMDGDRQNDPTDIPTLLALIPDADLVCGIRKSRKDPWIKKITSVMANWVRGWICEDNVTDTGCSLKVYRRKCLQNIKMYGGMHRFLPALFTIEGYRIIETEVNHRERVKGVSNYNFFNRSFNTIADLMAVRWMKNRHLDYELTQPNNKVTEKKIKGSP